MINKFKRSKNLIKGFAFLKIITISIMLITSCSKDNYDNINNNHDGIDKNLINFTQFKTETAINKFEPILQIKTAKKLNDKSKIEFSEFYIDTLAIKKLIYQNIKCSYTFRIYPLTKSLSPDEIYNLIYRKVNGKWESSIFYLLKKQKKNENKKIFEKIELVYDSCPKTSISSKGSGIGMCSYETISVHCDGSCEKQGYSQCDGFGCPTGQCIQRNIAYMVCDEGGGGSDDGTIGTGGLDYNGIGSTDPYVYSPNDSSNFTYNDPNYINAIKKLTFKNNLSVTQQSFFTFSQENTIAFNKIIQYQIDNNWSQESHDFSIQIINILCEDINIVVDNNSLSFIIEAKKQGKLETDIDEAFLQSVGSYLATSTIDPIVTQQLVTYYTIQCAVLKYNHPNWSPLKIRLMASLEFVHLTLDAFGLIPIGGEIADLANGVLYTIEGDRVNAVYSFANTVPLAGWATVTTKYAIKIVNSSQTAVTIANRVKLTWKVLADGTIYFGSSDTCRKQLRKVLGLAVGNLNQAHHIIPLNLQTNPIVQKAAKSGRAFHLNEELNGIALSTAVHSGSHAHYDGLIFQKLKLFAETNPNATPSQCYNKVNEIISQIRTAIANNPNTPINQLNF